MADFSPPCSAPMKSQFLWLCIDSHNAKNWLFVGRLNAGKRSAVMYTQLISARNHGVDPQAHLQAVIERLPRARPGDLDELLTANWAAVNRAAHPAIKSELLQAA